MSGSGGESKTKKMKNFGQWIFDGLVWLVRNGRWLGIIMFVVLLFAMLMFNLMMKGEEISDV